MASAGSSRLCARDSPRSGGVNVLAWMFLSLFDELDRDCLPTYTNARNDLLRMFESVSMAHTLRGTK